MTLADLCCLLGLQVELTMTPRQGWSAIIKGAELEVLGDWRHTRRSCTAGGFTPDDALAKLVETMVSRTLFVAGSDHPGYRIPETLKP